MEKRFLRLTDLACRLGASDAQAILSSDILVEDHLANLCREPRCENYGLSKSCPPHVSGPPGFREWLESYKHALVIKIDVPFEILLSNERRDIMRLLHEIVSDVEQAALDMGCDGAKAFAGGSCKDLFCQDHGSCRMLADDGRCRNPRHARSSMSGFGINVTKLMQTAGWAMQKIDKEADPAAASMAQVCGMILIRA